MTLRILDSYGNDKLARVFVAQTDDDSCIEFVESVQPPLPREKKWVLIVSTLKGCPVNCPICDAGGSYGGKLSKDEILGQIDYMVRRRFEDGVVPIPLTKIQFARMGDPAFNPAVLEVLHELPSLYEMPGLMPSISTVAPRGCEKFLRSLKKIKDRLYDHGRFQMQFSVHTTRDDKRRVLIPLNTLPLASLAKQGEDFFEKGDRKITLNFAAVRDYPIEANTLANLFDPEKFIIKLTPVNPTFASKNSGTIGAISPKDEDSWRKLAQPIRACGFDTIVSIGEVEENRIGSNCGMYVAKMKVKATA